MEDGPVFFVCDKCRGLFPATKITMHNKRICDGTMENSNAKLFAVDAHIAKSLSKLIDTCVGRSSVESDKWSASILRSPTVEHKPSALLSSQASLSPTVTGSAASIISCIRAAVSATEATHTSTNQLELLLPKQTLSYSARPSGEVITVKPTKQFCQSSLPAMQTEGIATPPCRKSRRLQARECSGESPVDLLLPRWAPKKIAEDFISWEDLLPSKFSSARKSSSNGKDPAESDYASPSKSSTESCNSKESSRSSPNDDTCMPMPTIRRSSRLRKDSAKAVQLKKKKIEGCKPIKKSKIEDNLLHDKKVTENKQTNVSRTKVKEISSLTQAGPLLEVDEIKTEPEDQENTQNVDNVDKLVPVSEVTNTKVEEPVEKRGFDSLPSVVESCTRTCPVNDTKDDETFPESGKDQCVNDEPPSDSVAGTNDDDPFMEESLDPEHIRRGNVSSRMWSKHRASLISKYQCYTSATVKVERGSKQARKTIDTPIYQCPLCKFHTIRVGHFHIHKITAHRERQYICEFCGYQSKLKVKLDQHRNGHLKPFACKSCSHRFGSRNGLVSHMQVKHGPPRTDRQEEVYLCTECGYKTTNLQRIKKHMKQHSGEQVPCGVEDCEFKAKYETTVATHRLQVHSIGRKYKCEICGHVFAQKYLLTIHRRRHLGTKNFGCPLCDYKAVDYQAVQRHLRTHTKEKMYQCDRCDFASSSHLGMHSHILTHLNIRPFRCSVCGYTSVAKCKVTRHIKTMKNECQYGKVEHTGVQDNFKISDYLIKQELRKNGGLDLKVVDLRRENQANQVVSIAEQDTEATEQGISEENIVNEILATSTAMEVLPNEAHDTEHTALGDVQFEIEQSQQEPEQYSTESDVGNTSLLLHNYAQLGMEEDGTQVMYVQAEDGDIDMDAIAQLPMHTEAGDVIYYMLENECENM